MTVSRILKPADDGELRIPALLSLPGDSGTELYCVFDVRPRPATGKGSDFTGEVMASDLPNPNRIAVSRCIAPDQWTSPEFLPGTPAVSSDPCVGMVGDEITIAYASTTGDVSYISSRRHGPRLEPWIATATSLTALDHCRLDHLYDDLGADALFATSGSTIALGNALLVPYVVRTPESMQVRVVHIAHGDVIAISDPITAPDANLDETTLALSNGRIIFNARVQGFEGRGAGVRYLAESSDGISFTEPRPWRIPDPGCNAKQLGNLFIHPHSHTDLANGTIVNTVTGETTTISEGEFGYSDAIWDRDELVIIFERESALWEARVPPPSAPQ